MKYLISTLTLLAATPALAEFELPNGCTGFLTVQAKGCLVSHHYTCESDAKGHKWRVDLDQNGPFYVSQTDHEARWIFTVNLVNGVREQLKDDSKDHASFTTLVREGRDDFDFALLDSNGDESFVSGFDRLTGKTVIIDDKPLLETENDVTTVDAEGKLVWRGRGNEYIDPELRIFFAGPDIFTTPDGDMDLDHSPVEFSHPGEPGFLDETPKFDCEAQTVSLPLRGGDNG